MACLYHSCVAVCAKYSNMRSVIEQRCPGKQYCIGEGIVMQRMMVEARHTA
jgi:hypothetical protein